MFHADPNFNICLLFYAVESFGLLVKTSIIFIYSKATFLCENFIYANYASQVLNA